MRRLPVTLVLLGSLLVAACGGSGTSSPAGSSGAATPAATSAGAPGSPAPSGTTTASVVPVFVNSALAVGRSRFLFSFLDPKTNQPVAAPDRTASVAFVPPGATDAGRATTATFVWAIEGSRGVYVVPDAEFPVAGDWKAVFVTQAKGGQPEAIAATFQVQDSLPTIAVGAQAPASDTPTLASVGGDLKHISTDTKPDPAFYRLSVKDALAAHTPFVLVFATPAFCQSAQCGPTLDRIKGVAATSPSDVAFINIEPYQLTFTEGRLQPVLDAQGQLQPVPAVNQWGILSEPWVFTVDGTGVVRGSFEGVVGDDELTAAVKAISGT